MHTESTTLPIRPAPLREVLDAGGNPRTILGEKAFDFLVTSLVEKSRDTEEHRAHWAAIEDWQIGAAERGLAVMFDGAWVPPDHDGPTLPPMNQDQVDHAAWVADACRDWSLLNALLAFCTEEERARFAAMKDEYARPFPLGVAPQERKDGDNWFCDGCGAELPSGTPGLNILGRTSDDGSVHSEEPECGPWCVSCVRDALSEMERLNP